MQATKDMGEKVPDSPKGRLISGLTLSRTLIDESSINRAAGDVFSSTLKLRMIEPSTLKSDENAIRCLEPPGTSNTDIIANTMLGDITKAEALPDSLDFTMILGPASSSSSSSSSSPTPNSSSLPFGSIRPPPLPDLIFSEFDLECRSPFETLGLALRHNSVIEVRSSLLQNDDLSYTADELKEHFPLMVEADPSQRSSMVVGFYDFRDELDRLQRLLEESNRQGNLLKSNILKEEMKQLEAQAEGSITQSNSIPNLNQSV
jgi:hypothetical protein